MVSLSLSLFHSPILGCVLVLITNSTQRTLLVGLYQPTSRTNILFKCAREKTFLCGWSYIGLYILIIYAYRSFIVSISMFGYKVHWNGCIQFGLHYREAYIVPMCFALRWKLLSCYGFEEKATKEKWCERNSTQVCQDITQKFSTFIKHTWIVYWN